MESDKSIPEIPLECFGIRQNAPGTRPDSFNIEWAQLEIHQDSPLPHLSALTVLIFPITGWLQFGSVPLQFVHGTARAVPVFGSDGSSGERVLGTSVQFKQKGTVPVSVPAKRFRRFRFLFRFPEKRFSGSVPGPSCHKLPPKSPKWGPKRNSISRNSTDRGVLRKFCRTSTEIRISQHLQAHPGFQQFGVPTFSVFGWK